MQNIVYNELKMLYNILQSYTGIADSDVDTVILTVLHA